MRRILFVAITVLISITTVHLFAEELASYPVRWEHGGTTDFGKLIIKENQIIFLDDKGEETVLALLYLDHVKIVKEIWIQVKSSLETGLSLGVNDVYNFGVIGEKPDPEIIAICNQNILKAKTNRLQTSATLPGERSRYMVYIGETIGDDIGLLIITEDKVLFVSDTGDNNHEWSFSDLKGIEIHGPKKITVLSRERAVIKLGLSTRNYQFTSHVQPFSQDDVAHIAGKIAAAKMVEQ